MVYYVACLSGELEYKRYGCDTIDELIAVLQSFYDDKYYHKLTIKKYDNPKHACDTCIDCLGVDILTINK